MTTKILDALGWMGMFGGLQKGECSSTFCVNRVLTLLLSLPTGQGENHNMYTQLWMTTTNDSSTL